MPRSRAIQVAGRCYALVLRLFVHGASRARRDDMQRTFEDGCLIARTRGGALRVCSHALAEIANVVAQTWRRRVGQDARITEPSRRPALAMPGYAWAIGADVRHAIRRLRATRADSLLIVLLLALGVATSSVIFGVADALLLRPTPFSDPARLVQIWSRSTSARVLTTAMPIELAPLWLARNDLFSMGGVYMPASALVTDHGEPEIIPGALLSPDLLETLGVAPLLGRTFRPDEGRPGSDRVVILSHEVWASRFGRAPDVLGQSMRINGSDYQVVGVMPEDFQYPFSDQRLWMPISLQAPAGGPRRMVTLTARMRPGLSRDVLRQEVEAAGPSIAVQAARPWKEGATVVFVDRSHASDAVQQSIELLAGATALLLLMVCLSAANIGLARVFARTRDAAIRSALGASRARLVRQAFVEDVVVGACALTVAWPLTVAGLNAARALLPAQFTRMTIHVVRADLRLAAVTAGLAFVTPMLAGLIPAFAGSRAVLLDVLRLESRSATGGRRSRILRDALVVLEVACAVVLLVSSALLGRSFLRLQHADVGFDSHSLISAHIGFPRAAFPTVRSRDAYLDRVVAALAHQPGIVAVTSATGVPPIDGLISFGSILVEGQPKARDNMFLSGYEIKPDFFTTVGVPIIAGRSFTLGEDRSHVVIGESLAASLWPGVNAVGRRFKWDDDPETWMEVVGVAATIHEDPQSPLTTPQVYLPLLPDGVGHSPGWQLAGPIGGYMRLAVRAADPLTAIPAIRRILRSAESTILIPSVERVDDQLARDLERPRFLLALMVVFAVAGLVLAAAAVYGVLSCLVSQGMREIGVRLVLGAEPAAIGRTVIRGALATVAVGLGIGVALAASVARVIGTLLFDVNGHDVGSYAGVVLVIVTAGLIAAWRPARRAMRADPLTLLRND